MEIIHVFIALKNYLTMFYLLMILQYPPSRTDVPWVLLMGRVWIDSNGCSYDHRSRHLSSRLDQNHTAEWCYDLHTQWISQTLGRIQKQYKVVINHRVIQYDFFFQRCESEYIPNWQIKFSFSLQALVASHLKPESLSMCPQAAPGCGLLAQFEKVIYEPSSQERGPEEHINSLSWSVCKFSDLTYEISSSVLNPLPVCLISSKFHC